MHGAKVWYSVSINMDTPIEAPTSEFGYGTGVCTRFLFSCDDRCTLRVLRSRQGEIDGVCTQLHIGYLRCEHICTRTQVIHVVLGHQVCSKMRLTTLSLFNNNNKKLFCCIKDVKQMIKRLT